ncbi:SufE family protein [Allofrancisella guangzhouensis]|uniref:Fe-S cluster assembly protein SufE n=1 Tax=Allofrancisella guangzhouensis TaxID=594679 RepID=A0A0A8E956_9GAMM|nr:SufE family protein [Allofrancisella guangzhouensis]AJC48686.1 Fe-S cluster assembly protein SufE [Allofrancisella guangzhouensis]MBK2027914.1 SufE family protein [Allofrancisella guangzhouensis]MBK2043965.1 SufE family protein [Allofrancisella guangzhouensis]MBK2046374.1 SufE family protein [Allofrancisella guangzhouensis]
MQNQVTQRQQNLIEELSFFEDWEDKYDYIISLGKQLPPFSEEKKVQQNLVKGCQSQVWFDSNIINDRLHFIAASDALIVSGLIGLLLRVYNDSKPSDILQSTTDFIKEIGFGSNLSATRANGLKSMLDYIYSQAFKYQ